MNSYSVLRFRRLTLALLPLLVLATACEKRLADGLSVGDTADLEGLSVTVDRIEYSDEAGGPLVNATAQPGTRFLWVHVSATNTGEGVIDQAVKVDLEYRDGRVGGALGIFYGPEHPALELAFRMLPGVSAEGWRLFEVPTNLDLSEVSVVFQRGVVGGRSASWSLE